MYSDDHRTTRYGTNADNPRYSDTFCKPESSDANIVYLTERQCLRKTEIEGYGIDKLSVSFPAESYQKSELYWSGISTHRHGQAAMSMHTMADRVYVGVQEIPDAHHRLWAKLEFNPSRLIDPEGFSLASVGASIEACDLAWSIAEQFVRPACSIQEARLKRMDVARDFEGVQSPAFFLQGLRAIRRPYARRSFTYNDPQRNMAETLYVGSGAGGARLYDKHSETAGGVPEGSVRFEVEARSRWLAKWGMRTLADVRSENVLRLARERFDWSGMGNEVAAAERVVELVTRSELSPASQRAFLGHLLMTAKGYPSKLSNDSAAKFNRLQRELGVVIASDPFAESFTSRLDFDSGREVINAA